MKRLHFEVNDRLNNVLVEDSNLQLLDMSMDMRPQLEYVSENKNGEKETEVLGVDELVNVMNPRAKGRRLPGEKITKIKFIEPIPVEEEEEEDLDEAVDQNEDLDPDVVEKWEKKSQENKNNKPFISDEEDDDAVQMTLFEE